MTLAAYVKLLRSIWRDDDFRALPASTQRLYMLLLSQPDVSYCGVLPFTPQRWGLLAGDTDADSVRTDIHRLTDADFVVVDDQTEELLIRSYVKYDEGYKVPNIRTALLRSVDEVLSVPLRNAVITLLVTLGITLGERVEPSQQQQPSPTAFSQQQQPDRSPNGSLPAAAAEAVELILDIRTEQDGQNIKRPQRWRDQTRHSLTDEHKPALLSHLADHPDADAKELAVACGFTVWDIARATRGAS